MAQSEVITSPHLSGHRAHHAIGIGRVGALAVALGIGTGIALATATAAAAESDSPRSDAATPASRSQAADAQPARHPSGRGAAAADRRMAARTVNAEPKPAAAQNDSTLRASSEIRAVVAPAASAVVSPSPASDSDVPASSTAIPAASVSPVQDSQDSAVAATPPIFAAADWLWKPIPASPVLEPNSAVWSGYLSAAGTQHVADLYYYGVTLVPATAVTASTPRYRIKFTEKWGTYPFGSYTVPIPKTTTVPVNDSSLGVVDPISQMVFGMWKAKYSKKKGGTWSAGWGGMAPLNGNGVDLGGGSATGSGVSVVAGLVTAAEFSAAVAANTSLNHALVFSSDIASSAFIAPAKKSDGRNIAGVATPMPEGTRVQIDPSINIDAIPGITPGEKVIAKTLQTYGAYLIDNGGARIAFNFETVPGSSPSNPGAVWTSAGLLWDYYDMAKIPWSSIRVIAPGTYLV